MRKGYLRKLLEDMKKAYKVEDKLNQLQARCFSQRRDCKEKQEGQKSLRGFKYKLNSYLCALVSSPCPNPR